MTPIKLASLSIGLVTAFASFSSSSGPSGYQLQSYGVGPGGTNSASSTTYKLQGTVGEQTNGSTAGSTKTANNGSIQTEQLNVPPAPTLSNGSGTYYNKLNFIINTGGNPSDTTFAVAVSTDSFVTTSYVQADGTLNTTPVYQTYTAWGSGSGTFMVGLTPSTAYKVKVAAKQGLFTNTEYGAFATATTAAPSTTFNVSPNSIGLGSLLPGSVVTSSNLTFSFGTDAVSGGAVYVSGASSGLFSTVQGHLIPAYTGNLALQTEGFGVQATNPGQYSGGPLTTVSPFNGTIHTVGAESTAPQQMLATTAPIVSGSANANVQAIVSSTTPAGADYQEVLTFIAAGSF
jgi:hypothetical protein